LIPRDVPRAPAARLVYSAPEDDPTGLVPYRTFISERGNLQAVCDCYDYELEEQAQAEPEPEKVAVPIQVRRLKK
jgi:hypothetical protein